MKPAHDSKLRKQNPGRSRQCYKTHIELLAPKQKGSQLEYQSFIEPHEGALHLHNIEGSDHFVNRQSELEKVERQIDLLLNPRGEPTISVINFFGVPGIGKSALLSRIVQLYQSGKGLAVLTLDFKQLFPKSPQPATGSPRGQLLHLFQAWFAAHKGSADGAARAMFEAVDAQLADDAQLQQAAAALATALQELTQPLLMVIDSWDFAPESLPPWFEKYLLWPLIQQRKVVAVFASQVPLRWWQHETRRLARSFALEPLTRDFVKEQVGCAPSLLDQVHRMTLGYPLANEQVRRRLQSRELSTTITREEQGRLLAEIVEEIERRILAELSPELRSVISVMTLFREFDVSTLRAVLPTFFAEFAARSQSSLLITMRDMLATRLVLWDDTKRAYHFDPTIRRIYSQQIQLNAPDHYFAVRKVALAYYEKLIREVHANRNGYVVEYCYHALYKHPDPFYNDGATVARELEEFLKLHYDRSSSQKQLRQSLLVLEALLRDDPEIRAALVEHSQDEDLLSQSVRMFAGPGPEIEA